MIVEGLGLSSTLVCDPTMLLSKQDWDIAIPDRKRIIEPYIFCYFLGSLPEHREFAKKLRKKTGYKIVALIHCEQYSKCDYGYADITPYDVGPDDFINLIRHAAIVLTDSFHGTCFSIINQKDFFSFPRHRDDETLSTNSRIYSLATTLGFDDRVVNVSDIEKADPSKKINYQFINDRLETFRNESREFLLRAIGVMGD